MVAALLLTALAQLGPCGPAGPIFCTGGAPARAFFEFAPADGTGMGAACACTTPTGAKGETMTFTRASSGTCLKQGLATTGIASGDLVTCVLNTPRVAPGANGHLALLKEHANTNAISQSDAIDVSPWTSTSSVIGLPTVTANAAIGPSGAMTADRLQTSACGSSPGCISVVYQVTSPSAPLATQIFIKGNGTSGVLGTFVDSGAGACIPCAYNSSTWSLCQGFQNGTSGAYAFGSVTGCGDGAATDVFIGGVQVEANVGAVWSSYIPTTTAPATRAADLAQFLGVTFATNNTGSMAASIIANHDLTDRSEHGIVAQSTAGPAYSQLIDYVTSGTTVNLYFSSGAATFPGATLTPYLAARMGGYWDHATQAISLFNGVAAGVPLATPPITVSNAIEIGQYSGTAQLDGYINQVCVDSDPLRCR